MGAAESRLAISPFQCVRSIANARRKHHAPADTSGTHFALALYMPSDIYKVEDAADISLFFIFSAHDFAADADDVLTPFSPRARASTYAPAQSSLSTTRRVGRLSSIRYHTPPLHIYIPSQQMAMGPALDAMGRLSVSLDATRGLRQVSRRLILPRARRLCFMRVD